MRNGRFEEYRGNVPESGPSMTRTDNLPRAPSCARGASGPQCLGEAPAFPGNYACYSRPFGWGSLAPMRSSFLLLPHPGTPQRRTWAPRGGFHPLEFEDPELQGETYTWAKQGLDLFATRLRCRPGSRDLVVMLRLMGGGTVWWDGVNVRAVGGEAEVSLEQAGLLVQLPARRMVSCQVRNLSDAGLPVKLGIDVVPEQASPDPVVSALTIEPGRSSDWSSPTTSTPAAATALRVTVTGASPTTSWSTTIVGAGLLDSRVFERPSGLPAVLDPHDQVVWEGGSTPRLRLRVRPASARNLVGTGRRPTISSCSAMRPRGPLAACTCPLGHVTDDYQVNVRAKVGRVEQGAQPALSPAATPPMRWLRYTPSPARARPPLFPIGRTA